MVLSTLLTAHLTACPDIYIYLTAEEKWTWIKGLNKSFLDWGQWFQHLLRNFRSAQKEEQDLGDVFHLTFILKKQNNEQPPQFSPKAVFSTVLLNSSSSLGYTCSVQIREGSIKLSLLAWWIALKRIVVHGGNVGNVLRCRDYSHECI